MTWPFVSTLTVATILALLPQGGHAQAPGTAHLPSSTVLQERASRRFPQPVRAGDLVGRKLLGPSENQPVLGRVTGLVRGADGRTTLVVRLAGWIWDRDRAVAVPIEAVGVLGEHVALLDISPEQLPDLPAVDLKPGSEIAAEESVRIGLVKPFH